VVDSDLPTVDSAPTLFIYLFHFKPKVRVIVFLLLESSCRLIIKVMMGVKDEVTV
jgi:hypothetical protein